MARLKKRADGRICITKMIDGTRKYFYGVTEAKAKKKLEEYEAEQHNNIYNSDILYDEWLDAWLDAIKHTISSSTYSNYNLLVDKHLRDLGTYKLCQMTSPLLRVFINKKLESGLSARTVEYIYTLLKASLRLAVNDDLIVKNPMDKVKKPKKAKTHEVVALSSEEVKKLLKSIDDEEEYNIIYTALSTGARRSELLGLELSPKDSKNKTITIDRTVIKEGTKVVLSPTTKNKSSKRTISIDDVLFNLLKKQRLIVLKRKMANPDYVDNNLLFPGPNGGPRNPDQLSRMAQRYKEKAKLPDGFTFHSLRHTHATLLLKAGVHFKIVQERLGHSSFQQTMDTYSHVTAGMDKIAAEKISEIL